MSVENVNEVVKLLRGWDVLDCCDDHLLSRIRYLHVFSRTGALFVTSDDNVFGVGQNGEHNLLGVEGDHFLVEAVKQPVRVERLSGCRIVGMSVGLWLGAAVTADGVLFSWGVTSEEVPISLPAPQRTEGLVRDVACGAAFLTALTEDAKVFLWGSMNMCTDPVEGRLLSGNLKVVAVSCGWWHVAMLTDKGELYTCGYGEDGQLGYTWYENEDVHKAQKVDTIGLCKQVVCGSISTLFVTMDGDVWACGENDIWQGALGVDSEDFCVVRPQKVRIASKVETLAAAWGSPNVYSALTCDGLVYCWGESRYPQLLQNVTILEAAFPNKRTSFTVDLLSVTPAQISPDDGNVPKQPPQEN